MKISQLKNIIKESIQKLITEQQGPPTPAVNLGGDNQGTYFMCPPGYRLPSGVNGTIYGPNFSGPNLGSGYGVLNSVSSNPALLAGNYQVPNGTSAPGKLIGYRIPECIESHDNYVDPPPTNPLGVGGTLSGAGGMKDPNHYSIHTGKPLSDPGV